MRNQIHVIVIMILFLTISPYLEAQDEILKIEFSTYPDTLMIGDTLYVTTKVTNLSDQINTIPMPSFQPMGFVPEVVFYELSWENASFPGAFELLVNSTGQRLGGIKKLEVLPNQTITAFTMSVQLPPLEDLYLPFFEKMMNEMKKSAEDLTFDFSVSMAGSHKGNMEKDIFARIQYECSLTLKLRNAEEMAMIEEWYRKTPEDYFPVLNKGSYIRKVPPQGLRKESGRKILGQSPWLFVNIGNRYPGDPNIPITWQGWQELEESISPSTMRDEIRLTRILIQYCDTKDKKVLEELKTWFVGMNEVQRTCMAKSIYDRSRQARGTNVHASFFDSYKAIHEYDVSAKSESETEFLKQLGLLE